MKLSSFKLITVLLIGAITFSSCRKCDDDKYSSSYFPLEVGNTWVYKTSYYYAGQTISPIGTATITLIKDTILANGQLAFLAEQKTNNNPNLHYFLWYKKGGFLIESDRMNNYEYQKYKMDLQVNTEWHLSEKNPNDNDKAIAKEYFSSYEIPNGKAPAYRIVQGDSSVLTNSTTGWYQEEVYAPQIGMIKRTTVQNYYGLGVTEWILTDYYSK